MKIATWNVNSLRVRLPQVLDWLEQARPDVLALQETKITDEEFPTDDLKNVGYHAIYAGQKTYNGVAILSKKAGTHIITEIPDLADPQKRVIGANFGEIRLINLYVPNGSSVGSDKYQYKLYWLNKLRDYVANQRSKHSELLVVGDFNITPEDQDVHNPELWQGQILCSAPERAALHQLMDVGLVDLFREFEQEPNAFSWWDYRAGAFRRNMGLRIDLILASKSLVKKCTACYIDREPRKLAKPSDHAPVVAEFDI